MKNLTTTQIKSISRVAQSLMQCSEESLTTNDISDMLFAFCTNHDMLTDGGEDSDLLFQFVDSIQHNRLPHIEECLMAILPCDLYQERKEWLQVINNQ